MAVQTIGGATWLNSSKTNTVRSTFTIPEDFGLEQHGIYRGGHDKTISKPKNDEKNKKVLISKRSKQGKLYK